MENMNDYVFKKNSILVFNKNRILLNNIHFNNKYTSINHENKLSSLSNKSLKELIRCTKGRIKTLKRKIQSEKKDSKSLIGQDIHKYNISLSVMKREIKQRKNKNESKKTKLYFDTEFTGLRNDSDLISIGIVSECGKSFYAEFTDYDKSQVDEWIEDNVISNLLFNDYTDTGVVISNNMNNFKMKANKKSIREKLTKWLNQFKKIYIFSDVLGYDWILFRKLFNDNVPEHVYYIPCVLSELLYSNGVNNNIKLIDYAMLTKKEKKWFKDNSLRKHNSFYDAYIIKKCHNNLFKGIKF